MAIMWEPPADRVSLVPTPAELAWRRWLMEALIAKDDDTPTPPAASSDGAADELKPAA